MIHSLFDLETRFAKMDKNTDPLARLTAMIDGETFRPTRQALREKPRKSNAGAKGYDRVLLLKGLILQSLYNLSDDPLEFQILGRYAMRRKASG